VNGYGMMHERSAGHVNGHSAGHMNGHSMNISRFFGSTNREAMRQVRMALGSEALIVSNRRVNGGVEILATDGTKVAGDAPVAVVTAPPPAAQQPAMLMDAITALRGELEHRMEDLVWNQQLKQAPQALGLFQTLLGLGFSTALLRPMLKRLPTQLSGKAAFAWAREELMQCLPVCADEDALWRPGLALALVGPTGVGKTTTLAKLAARAVRRFGSQRVALLTTDTYRIGACEQLKIYGQILRVPVYVAHDTCELERIVQSLSADHVLLIDNVGVSQRDDKVKAQAAMLRGAGRAIARLLVLNAASHGDTLDEVARTYHHDGGTPLAGCIVSKRDEALRLAPALDTAIRHQLTIHYVSDGQKVPEHLSCASAEDLVDQALSATASGHTLYAPNRADLAALMTLVPTEDKPTQDARRLLSDVLALSLPTGQTLSLDVVQQACREIDAQSVCAQAFKLWQAHRHATPVPLEQGKLAHTLLAAARSEYVQTPSPASMVVAHDHARVATARQGQGRLCWAQMDCLSDDGYSSVASSPLQSLQFSNAWTSSCGASALGGMDITQARLQQVQWFEAQMPDVPVLHVFEGGSSGLWRSLDRLNVSWAASCAPGTAVVHEDTLTSAGALASRAAYHMVDTAHWQNSLQTCAGQPLAHTTVWYAVDAVMLRQRGQADAHMRLVHLRLQDRRDGSLIRQYSALSRTSLDDAAWVQVLVARLERKWITRAVQTFWRLFMQPDGVGSEEAYQQQAMLAWRLGACGSQAMP